MEIELDCKTEIEMDEQMEVGSYLKMDFEMEGQKGISM